MKRTFSIATVIALLVVFCVPVSAAYVGIAPIYEHVGVISAGLSIASNGRANPSSSLVCADGNMNATITMTLQQYKNNAWIDVKSWSVTDSSKYTFNLSEYHYVASGYTYRVKTRAQIYSLSGTLLEDVTMHSKEKDY